MDLEDNPALGRQFAEKNDPGICGTDELGNNITSYSKNKTFLRNQQF